MPVRAFSGMMGNTGGDYLSGNKLRSPLREPCEEVEDVVAYAVFKRTHLAFGHRDDISLTTVRFVPWEDNVPFILCRYSWTQELRNPLMSVPTVFRRD